MSWLDLAAMMIEWVWRLNWPLYLGWLLFGWVLLWISFGSHNNNNEVRSVGSVFGSALVLIWYGWFVRPKDDENF